MPSAKFVSPVARSATDDELRWINHDKEGWLKRGCPAISAFKLTGNRFMKAPHDITAETSSEAYKHMGPGYYDIGGEKSNGKSAYNPMQDQTPRFGYTPYALVTEYSKPGMEHIGPGQYIAGHHSFIKEGTALADEAAFGLSLSSPRIQQRTKHDIEMAQLWTNFDHVADNHKAWRKAGCFISPHAMRFHIPTEDDCARLRERGKQKDSIMRQRMQNIRRTGKAEDKKAGAQQPQPPQSQKGLGGPDGTPFSMVPRFGHTPFERKTELQFPSMGHVGPGTYSQGTDHSSIRNRAGVTKNQSASFAATAPRFERKRVVDISDGGVASRHNRAVRTEREALVRLYYGEKDEDAAMRQPATVR